MYYFLCLLHVILYKRVLWQIYIIIIINHLWWEHGYEHWTDAQFKK